MGDSINDNVLAPHVCVTLSQGVIILDYHHESLPRHEVSTSATSLRYVYMCII